MYRVTCCVKISYYGNACYNCYYQCKLYEGIVKQHQGYKEHVNSKIDVLISTLNLIV